MDTGSSHDSNTLNLVALVQSMEGNTFAEQSANAKKVLEARVSRLRQGSDEWYSLMGAIGFVANFIRFDNKVPPKYKASVTTLAAKRAT